MRARSIVNSKDAALENGNIYVYTFYTFRKQNLHKN